MARLRPLSVAIILYAFFRRTRRPNPFLSPGAEPMTQVRENPSESSSAKSSSQATDWWTMIGTIMAGIAATAALAVSVLTYNMQQEDRQDRLADQTKAESILKARYAARLTWWIEWDYSSSNRSTNRFTLVVQNSSSEPMTVVALAEDVPKGDLVLIEQYIVNPKDDGRKKPTEDDPEDPAEDDPKKLEYLVIPKDLPQPNFSELAKTRLGVIPPCTSSRYPMRYMKGSQGIPGSVVIQAMVILDPNGHVWLRDFNGKLSESTEYGFPLRSLSGGTDSVLAYSAYTAISHKPTAACAAS